MSFRRKQGNFKFYLSELVILILGITHFFWLNDWRESNAEKNLEFEISLERVTNVN
jgi:hypothetical protein